VDVDTLYAELTGYLNDTDVTNEGEHLITNYERVTGIIIRLQAIKNEIAYLEMFGRADSSLKKFRTTILEDTIRTFEKVAMFESRKISAKQVEIQLDKER
jgi:hypothetical protein